MSTKVQIHLKNKVIKMPKNSKKWPIIKRDLSVMTSKKISKKGEYAQDHTYFMSKKSKRT